MVRNHLAMFLFCPRCHPPTLWGVVGRDTTARWFCTISNWQLDATTHLPTTTTSGGATKLGPGPMPLTTVPTYCVGSTDPLNDAALSLWGR